MLKLQAVEISKTYRGRKVVDDVELEIGQGEVVGLLGPNGAGKTTTFSILVGLARPDSGRVLLNGDEITDLPMYLRARSGISYLPQEPSVFRQLTSERSEEHTSELQSRLHLVCRLLLEKKKGAHASRATAARYTRARSARHPPHSRA